jgi:iron(III) transport system substrate-binding protein
MRAPAAAVALAAVLAGCGGGGPPSVTVYSAVDEEYARPLLERFEKESGVRVNLVVDTEQTKTIGLVTSLEEDSAPGRTPRCDVFWNNEPAWTVRLAREGVLDKYDSPAARDIPAAWRDPEGFWAANGLRARVFIVHAPSAAARAPSSYADLADPAFKGRGSIAKPYVGTTLSHCAALRAAIGPEAFSRWLKDAAANGTAFASGNGSVARDVGVGGHAFGFTDTDDFWVRKSKGDPVQVVFPDQGEKQIGTFVLPITVSLVRRGPHRSNGERLYDWLVSAAAEEALSATDYATIPVRPTSKPGPGAVSLSSFRAAQVDWGRAVENLDGVLKVVKEILEGK